MKRIWEKVEPVAKLIPILVTGLYTLIKIWDWYHDSHQWTSRLKYEKDQLLTLDWQQISKIDLYSQRIIVWVDSAVAEKFNLELYTTIPEKMIT